MAAVALLGVLSLILVLLQGNQHQAQGCPVANKYHKEVEKINKIGKGISAKEVPVRDPNKVSSYSAKQLKQIEAMKKRKKELGL